MFLAAIIYPDTIRFGQRRAAVILDNVFWCMAKLPLIESRVSFAEVDNTISGSFGEGEVIHYHQHPLARKQ